MDLIAIILLIMVIAFYIWILARVFKSAKLQAKYKDTPNVIKVLPMPKWQSIISICLEVGVCVYAYYRTYLDLVSPPPYTTTLLETWIASYFFMAIIFTILAINSTVGIIRGDWFVEDGFIKNGRLIPWSLINDYELKTNNRLNLRYQTNAELGAYVIRYNNMDEQVLEALLLEFKRRGIQTKEKKE